MTDQTPGCGSNSEARKRREQATDPHAGCTPGTCREGEQWRTVSCSSSASPNEEHDQADDQQHRDGVDGQEDQPLGTLRGSDEEIHAAQPTQPPTEGTGDGPECDTCGSQSCPGALALSNGDSTGCPLLPIAQALEYDRCEYGCSRSVAQSTVRHDVAPVVEQLRAQAAYEAMWSFFLRLPHSPFSDMVQREALRLKDAGGDRG